MSVKVALDNVCLRPAERWGHTEYSLDYHREYLAKRTGLPAGHPAQQRSWYEQFQLDLIWNTDDGLVDWDAAGRTTNMGHAAYAADGADWQAPAACPFSSVEEVWAFDAVDEYGLPPFDAQVRAYEAQLQSARVRFPNQLTSGGYYKTIVSGAIAAFGWEMLLMAAVDISRMERVFDSFFRRTLFFMKAWAQTSAKVIIQHDDFVWTGGPFMHPDLYHRVIIPRYAQLWKPLRRAGQKVLFCADGGYTAFAPEIAEAGADGFIFEPCMDFGRMAARFGQTHCLVGSFVDCRSLTFGHWDRVRADIDRTLACLEACKGAIVAVGNHLPPNIPDDMLDRYFDYLLPRLDR